MVQAQAVPEKLASFRRSNLDLGLECEMRPDQVLVVRRRTELGVGPQWSKLIGRPGSWRELPQDQPGWDWVCRPESGVGGRRRTSSRRWPGQAHRGRPEAGDLLMTNQAGTGICRPESE
jgi:hypothetical protein